MGRAVALQERGFACWPTPSDLRLRPGSQFHEAFSLCQSRHPVKAAIIPTAAPKATNNATIIAMITTKVSVTALPFVDDQQSGSGRFSREALRLMRARQRGLQERR
jgi:hypothetical protein